MYRWMCLLLCVCVGCFDVKQAKKQQLKQQNEKKDKVQRLSHEKHYEESPLLEKNRDPYPWELGYIGLYAPITKEAFRCKGSHKNPPKQKVEDCGGISSHGLPLRGGREFIYPVLLDLLNYIQQKTSYPVTITCGHRCPMHHAYVDSSLYHLHSKHMIGAEVDFYVPGMEEQPLEVINLIFRYYKEMPCYKGQTEYENFLRLDGVKVDVSTTPWYNKEILVKLYKKEEGRDMENAHSYPYINIQVRFDREKNEKVTYCEERAFRGYERY